MAATVRAGRITSDDCGIFSAVTCWRSIHRTGMRRRNDETIFGPRNRRKRKHMNSRERVQRRISPGKRIMSAGEDGSLFRVFGVFRGHCLHRFRKILWAAVGLIGQACTSAAASDLPPVIAPPESFFQLVVERDREPARQFYKKYLDLKG